MCTGSYMERRNRDLYHSENKGKTGKHRKIQSFGCLSVTYCGKDTGQESNARRTAGLATS